MKLVILVNGIPVFNPEVKTIKSFRDIIVRDKGSKGDADGREKKQATKELAYVHFATYYNSEFLTSVSEDERPEKIRKHLDLPIDWKADALIEIACMTYKELVYTPSADSLVEARESLFSANKIIKILRKQLETLLQQLDSQLTGLDDEEAEEQISRLTDKTVKLYDKIMSIADKMPTTLDTINKLEERVKKEMQKEQTGRGKSEINEWEM